MTWDGADASAQLDAYLDGLLNDEQRAEFERRLAQDSALREAVQLHHAIDASVRRRFAPRKSDALLAHLRQTTNVNGRAGVAVRMQKPTPRRQRLAAAALLALIGISGWQIISYLRPQPVFDPYAGQHYRAFETVYRDELADGFEPDWVCESDEVFAQTFEQRLGQPLLLAQLPPGDAMVGLAYCNSLSRRTIHMLARAGHTSILVFVDKIDFDARPTVAAESGLNLFRRQLGSLVLYELTPLAAPRFLDAFYIPAKSAQPESGQSPPP